MITPRRILLGLRWMPLFAVCLLSGLFHGTEAGAEGWEWSGALGIVSPGGDLKGIPSALSVRGGARKCLTTLLDFSADIGASLHSEAGVDILYLMASPGIAAVLPVGGGLSVGLSLGYTVHFLDYVQVPIDLQGAGPFVGVELAAANKDGEAGLEIRTHRFEVEDSRNIRSGGWTTCFALRFSLP